MGRGFKILLALTFATLQTSAYATINVDKINTLAHTFMQETKTPGMSIAVIDKDEIKTFNYGYADDIKKIPTSDNTIYTLASLTKTFTATLSSIAAVEDKLNLNASFNQYIPQLKNNKNLMSITPSMLLGHVSSLPFNLTPKPVNYEEAMSEINQFVPPYTPGTRYQYSNAGIGLMGYVLQNIYSKNYETLVNEKINQPLGMTSTYLNAPANKLPYITLGHDEHGTVPYSTDLDVWFAAGWLKSTITDMAKYLNAQINYAEIKDPILKQAIAQVHQNKYCFANKVSCEQLGWQAHVMSQLKSVQNDAFYNVDSQGNITFNQQKIINNANFPKKYFVDKTGAGFGMSSYMAYIPDERLGVVILLNRFDVNNKLMSDQRIKLGRDILKGLE